MRTLTIGVASSSDGRKRVFETGSHEDGERVRCRWTGGPRVALRNAFNRCDLPVVKADLDAKMMIVVLKFRDSVAWAGLDDDTPPERAGSVACTSWELGSICHNEKTESRGASAKLQMSRHRVA